MTNDLEARVTRLEDLTASLTAASYAHGLALGILVRYVSDPERVLLLIGLASERMLQEQADAGQDFTAVQRAITADVLDSIAQSLKPAD